MGREQITNVKIVQPATLVYKPVAPKKTVLLALGLAVATIVGIGSAFFMETVDHTLRTTDQVEAQLGLPVLLSLPYRKRGVRGGTALVRSKSAGGRHGQNEYFPHANFQALTSALLSPEATSRGRARTVGVVGCDDSKLSSRAASDLASQAASSFSEPVLLIDADARHQHLGASPGWSDVLAGTADAGSCIRRPKGGNLAVMEAGGQIRDVRPSNAPVEVLGQIDGIKEEFRLIVFDLPAISDLEALAAMEWIDEVVLVVEAEKTRIQAAQRQAHA